MAGKKNVKHLKTEEAQGEKSAAVPMDNELERVACNPVPVNKAKFNDAAVIPYGCTPDLLPKGMFVGDSLQHGAEGIE